MILTVGVNGTGKTTTIGKLAWHLRKELGVSVLLGAADTFRAAATEQLEEWARRAECEDRRPARRAQTPVRWRSRPASSSEHGREGIDVVIVDTAGRLHTQDDLMGELAKVEAHD